MNQVKYFKDKKYSVVCAFMGTGKSYLTKNFPNYADVELYLYKERLDIYLEVIKTQQDIYRYKVLTGCWEENLKLFQKHNIDFVVVLPSKDQKEEYLKRYIDRGNGSHTLKDMQKNFEKYIDDVMKIKCEKVILNKGQYLSDIIDNIYNKGV